MRKYDAFAISLLMFTAVLSVWLGIWGPTNTTTWKDWQPLMAAFVALTAATLAYNAAMAKVAFDREVSEKATKQKALGVSLRLEYALDVLRHEASVYEKRVQMPEKGAPDKTFKVTELNFTEPKALDDAWQNLEMFAAELARNLFNVRTDLYNIERFKIRHGEHVLTLQSGKELSALVTRLSDLLKGLQEECNEAIDEIEKLTKIRGSKN